MEHNKFMAQDFFEHFKNYPPNFDPSYNKDGWHLSHWFGDKRHFRPWYDDDADYNTNAKSYYDYLGFRIKQLDYIIWAINGLFRRNVTVADTSTINMSKLGDWLKGDDTINLSSVVKFSNDPTNAARDLNGVYVKDLEPELIALRQKLEDVRRQLQDELNDEDAKIGDLSKLIKQIQDRLNGVYKTIPKANFYHKYYNGSQDVPTGWGTFHAGAIYGENNVTLNVRLPYANHNLQNLKLNGGALPLSNTPKSYVLGFGFTGEYAFLNDMNIESIQITNGAPHIEPVSAHASWTIGYNFDHDREIYGGDPFQMTLATFADGYNDKNTFSEHYRGIYLKGDIVNVTFQLSGKVPEKFWKGDNTMSNIIEVNESEPHGVPDLGRDVTRTINSIME
mgnify:CR=1 FL=1